MCKYVQNFAIQCYAFLDVPKVTKRSTNRIKYNIQMTMLNPRTPNIEFCYMHSRDGKYMQCRLAVLQSINAPGELPTM